MLKNKIETIEEFYRGKFDWMPNNLNNEIGHFNIFKLEPFVPGIPISIPYKRRDYYKIMLVMGNSEVHYGDKVVEIKKQALSFSSPQIPYKWEHLDNVRSGVYCVFNHHFFTQFGSIQQYAVFQPDGTHIFELTDEQVGEIEKIFQRMFAEISSEFTHKYDVLRTLALELVYYALKLDKPKVTQRQSVHASQRIATLFLELLERQFPIDDTHQTVQIRTASEFAKHLNIHVNYLNRAVKDITEKTTTQLIAERILQEAKFLLKHSNWSISDIAFGLGFTEVTHFINFFKKHIQLSPLKFRNV